LNISAARVLFSCLVVSPRGHGSSVANSIFGAKSHNRVSGIQEFTDCQTLEQATLRPWALSLWLTTNEENELADLCEGAHVRMLNRELCAAFKAGPLTCSSKAGRSGLIPNVSMVENLRLAYDGSSESGISPNELRRSSLSCPRPRAVAR
jgi:hypothetical protein